MGNLREVYEKQNLVLEKYAKNGIKDIDLVYLWCDGNDEKFRRKKQLFLKGITNLSNQVLNDCRFRDNDELKYSLRSVQKFVPWVHHIYIVVDSQVPVWLNLAHPKITIVQHSDIMPFDALPSFNSMAMEACIHNIKGLSEYFIYGNDDTFFGGFVGPDYFFDLNGNPKVFVKKYSFKRRKLQPSNLKLHNCYKSYVGNAVRFIANEFGAVYHCLPSHCFMACRKSFRADFMKKYPNLFHNTVYSRFRCANNFNQFVFDLYDNCLGRNKFYFNKTLGGRIFECVPNKKFPLSYYFLRLFCRKGMETTGGGFVLDDIVKYHPKLFCINDTENLTDKQRQINKQFLADFFPDKSYFEK